MVGIQYSTGCRGCRARRKKCDKLRPSCGLCTHRNIECIYKDDMNFVMVNPSRHSPSKKPTHSPGLAPEFKASFASISCSSTSRSYNNSNIHHLPQSCLASSYHAQAHGALLERYAPTIFGNVQGNTTSPRYSAASSWLYSAYWQAHRDSLLSDSLAALSLAYHERQNALGNYALGSRVMYGKAMKTLSRRLGTRELALEDSTLAAALLLASFETQSPNTKLVDRYRHANGISTIISMRGSRNFETDFGRQLYLGSRMLYLIGIMGRRKALGLVESKYQTFFNGSCSSYVHLFDILQTLPGVIELGDEVEHAIVTGTEPELQVAISTFKFASEELRSRLDTWRDQLGLEEDETEDKPLSWDEPSLLYEKLPVDSPARVFENFLCFRSPDVAQQLIVSWACLILIEGWLLVMQRKLTEYGRNTASLFQTDVDQECVYIRCNTRATYIIKSLEYFVHPDMGLANSEFIGLPMTVAMGWWKTNQTNARELMWFPVILTRMRQTNIGYSDLMRLIAMKGGGGLAFRALIEQDQSPSTW